MKYGHLGKTPGSVIATSLCLLQGSGGGLRTVIPALTDTPHCWKLPACVPLRYGSQPLETPGNNGVGEDLYSSSAPSQLAFIFDLSYLI